jgi:hypothetical protein
MNADKNLLELTNEAEIELQTNDRLKVTTSNRKFLATPKFYVYNSMLNISAASGLYNI